MLKIMRKNTFARDTIIVLVCLAMAAYVLVGFGSAPPTSPDNVITTVGDVKVKRRDVEMLLRRGSNNPSGQDVRQQQALEMMQRAILQNGALKAGIVVSDNELRERVILSRTAQDGSFLDDEQWANRIQRAYGVQVGTYEDYMRDHWMRQEKFGSLFYEGIYVSADEIEERFQEENRKLDMEMVTINTTDVQAQTALENDDQVRAFYNENKDDFMTGKRRLAQFITFPVNDYLEQVKPTAEEVSAYYAQNTERYRQQEQAKASHILIKTESRSDEEALAEITRIKKEVDDGLDFAEAANKYTEDDSNDGKGGDLGFFGRGRMVPPFENMAFTLAEGQISEPVKTSFGYHIIKKTGYQEERMRPFEEVKSGIEATVSRAKAREYASGLAETFYLDTSNGAAFHEAAEKSGYTVHVTPAFDEDSASNLGDILGKNFQVRRAVFTLENLNDITPVVNAGSQMVVAQWVAEEEPRALEPDQELDRIKAMASKIAGRAFIENLFSEIREKATAEPEKSLKDLAGEREFLRENSFKDSGSFTANTIPYELRREDLDFDEDLYPLEPGQFLEGIETSMDTRFVLARVKTKESPDMATLDNEQARLAEQLRSQRGYEAFISYVYQQRKILDPSGIKQAQIDAAFNIR